MDRVGGYIGYLALIEDARAYDDVLVALAGEADATSIRELEAKAKGRQ